MVRLFLSEVVTWRAMIKKNLNLVPAYTLHLCHSPCTHKAPLISIPQLTFSQTCINLRTKDNFKNENVNLHMLFCTQKDIILPVEHTLKKILTLWSRLCNVQPTVYRQKESGFFRLHDICSIHLLAGNPQPCKQRNSNSGWHHCQNIATWLTIDIYCNFFIFFLNKGFVKNDVPLFYYLQFLWISMGFMYPLNIHVWVQFLGAPLFLKGHPDSDTSLPMLWSRSRCPHQHGDWVLHQGRRVLTSKVPSLLTLHYS